LKSLAGAKKREKVAARTWPEGSTKPVEKKKSCLRKEKPTEKKSRIEKEGKTGMFWATKGTGRVALGGGDRFS